VTLRTLDAQAPLGHLAIFELNWTNFSDNTTPRASLTVRVTIHVDQPPIISVPKLWLSPQQQSYLLLVDATITLRIRTADTDIAKINQLRFNVGLKALVADSQITAWSSTQLDSAQADLTLLNWSMYDFFLM
jgi:hypothetical protein